VSGGGGAEEEACWKAHGQCRPLLVRRVARALLIGVARASGTCTSTVGAGGCLL
jgi:hypothetical protein